MHHITVAPNLAPAPTTTAHPPVIAAPTPAPTTYARALSAGSPLARKHNTPKHHIPPLLVLPSPIEPMPTPPTLTEAALFHAISDVMDKALNSVDPNGMGAKSIFGHAQVIWVAIRPLLGYTHQQRQPRFEEGNPWHSVVFHGVPVNGKLKQHLRLSMVQTWLCLKGPNSPVRAVTWLTMVAFSLAHGARLHIMCLFNDLLEHPLHMIPPLASANPLLVLRSPSSVPSPACLASR
ncbi:hypothetical protein C8J57DRAFT_1529943 [Mycena rebaudengoi]|nr:hypothetical protein C8J57DRAFT_1529943 [Mycena rebaudengoi]